jgi:hypothetical protein
MARKGYVDVVVAEGDCTGWTKSSVVGWIIDSCIGTQ